MAAKSKKQSSSAENPTLVYYDPNIDAWKLKGKKRTSSITNFDALNLFDTRQIAVHEDDRDHYLALVNDFDKTCELILVYLEEGEESGKEVIRRTYELSYFPLMELHRPLLFCRRIKLDEEETEEKYIILKKELSEDDKLREKIGEFTLISYRPKTKAIQTYRRVPDFTYGQDLSYTELRRALELEIVNLADCRSNLHVEFIIPEEGEINSIFSFKSMKDKEDYFLVIDKQSFANIGEGLDYYSLFELNTDNIVYTSHDDFQEARKLETSKPKKNDSSLVLQSDEGSLQKPEVEGEPEFNRGKIISELQEGKIVKIPTDYLDEKEFYQVRLLENQEYESILEAVRLEKASPIEVFIEGEQILIIDGYTRRKAALETTKPLVAFLSSAKTKEEAEARAFQANTGRGNLTPIEEAKFIEKFREKYKVKNDTDLAEKLSKPKDIISRRRKLAAATEKIQELYSIGHITLLQTEAIGSITPLDQQRAYEDDWFDNRGKMTRNHPEGTIKVVSISYTEETHVAKRGLIPYFKYVLELSNKKTKEVYSRTNTDFAKMLKKGEVISEDEDTLEILCKPMTDTLKMSKRVLVGWPISAELNKQTDLEIIPEDELIPPSITNGRSWQEYQDKASEKDEEIKPPSPVIDSLQLFGKLLKVVEIDLIENSGDKIHYKVTLSNEEELYITSGAWDNSCVIFKKYSDISGELPELFFDKIEDGEIYFKSKNIDGHHVYAFDEIKTKAEGRINLLAELGQQYDSIEKVDVVIDVSQEYQEKEDIWLSEVKAKIDLLPVPFKWNLKKYRKETNIPVDLADWEIQKILHKEYAKILYPDSFPKFLYQSGRRRIKAILDLEFNISQATTLKDHKHDRLLQLLYHDLTELSDKIADVLKENHPEAFKALGRVDQ